MIHAISRRARGFAAKLLLALLALLCLVIGLVGLVLPLIPGLVFLLLAALCAARLWPRLHVHVQRLPGASVGFGQNARLSRLSLADKCRYGFWMTLKVTVDTLHLGWRAASRKFQGR